MAYIRFLGHHEAMGVLQKLKKALGLGLLIIFAAFTGWGYYRFQQNPLQQKIPLPFSWAPQTLPGLRLWPTLNEHAADQVQVLFVGDEFAQEFWKWREPFNQELSNDLSAPFRLGIIGHAQTGLHRLVQQIKFLEKLPKIVVLMVGGAEGKELLLHFSEYAKIKRNLELAHNPYLATLIEFFPIASRFIYQPIKQVELLPEIRSLKGQLFDYEYQMAAEIGYLLFQSELEELIQYLQKNKVQVVISTLPIRLEQAPHGNCVRAQEKELNENTIELWKLLKEGKAKDALSVIEKKKMAHYPGPMPPYLKALALEKTGDRVAAKENFLLASALDCHLWRPNHTINSIIRSVAADHDVPLFDFEKWHNSDFAGNTLFINSTIPQPLYMEKAAKLLGKTLRSFLRL